MRYSGTQQDLKVSFDSADAMQAAYEAAHQARFDFTSPDANIMFEMLSVEAIEEARPSLI